MEKTILITHTIESIRYAFFGWYWSVWAYSFFKRRILEVESEITLYFCHIFHNHNSASHGSSFSDIRKHPQRTRKYSLIFHCCTLYEGRWLIGSSLTQYKSQTEKRSFYGKGNISLLWIYLYYASIRFINSGRAQFTGFTLPSIRRWN